MKTWMNIQKDLKGCKKVEFVICVKTKQWPLAPNSQDSLITRANVSRRVTFFSKMAFGECRRVWRVRANQFGESRRVWRVRANQVGECRRVWRVLAKPLDECWPKQDRLFYTQITYFICIKRSSLHSINLPNSPDLLHLLKTRQTCLLQVWQVQANQVCKFWRVWRVRANQVGECRRVWRVRPIFKKGHFGEYSNLPKMANFRRVLKFDKFAVEWPLLSQNFKRIGLSFHSINIPITKLANLLRIQTLKFGAN